METITKFQIPCGSDYCFQITHDKSSGYYRIGYYQWKNNYWKPIDGIKFTKNEAEYLVKFLEFTLQFNN